MVTSNDPLKRLMGRIVWILSPVSITIVRCSRHRAAPSPRDPSPDGDRAAFERHGLPGADFPPPAQLHLAVDRDEAARDGDLRQAAGVAQAGELQQRVELDERVPLQRELQQLLHATSRADSRSARCRSAGRLMAPILGATQGFVNGWSLPARFEPEHGAVFPPGCEPDESRCYSVMVPTVIHVKGSDLDMESLPRAFLVRIGSVCQGGQDRVEGGLTPASDTRPSA